MKKQRWLVFGVGILISLAFLWFSLGALELDKVWDAIRTANYGWVIPGVLIYFVSVWVRSWRWAYLLRSSKRMTGTRLFPIMVIGYMGNDLFPFRLGELLRAYVLWRKEGVNLGTTFTTAVVERLFDGLTMVLFVIVGLALIPLDNALVHQAGTIGSVVFLTALVAFLLLASRPDLLRRLAEWFINRLIPVRFRPPLLKLIDGVIEGLQVFRSLGDVLGTFGLTVVVWLLELGKYWLVAQAFPALHLSYPAILLMGGSINLLTALPSLPGYVGTFETGVKILVELGADATAAGGYILVLHALLWLPVVLLGLVFFFREGMTLTDIRSVASSERA